MTRKETHCRTVEIRLPAGMSMGDSIDYANWGADHQLPLQKWSYITSWEFTGDLSPFLYRVPLPHTVLQLVNLNFTIVNSIMTWTLFAVIMAIYWISINNEWISFCLNKLSNNPQEISVCQMTLMHLSVCTCSSLQSLQCPNVLFSKDKPHCLPGMQSAEQVSIIYVTLQLVGLMDNF